MVRKGLCPKLTVYQGPKGSGRTFQTVGTERAETLKAAVCLACLIKNKETSVTAAERKGKHFRDEIEGWCKDFSLYSDILIH